MSTAKQYTIRQLRGAFAAGMRSKDAPKPPKVGNATQRAMDWMEQSLVSLADQYGPMMAFSRQRKGSDWVLVPIVNLFNCGGTEREVDAVFGRVIARLTERHLDAPGAVAHAEDCLERWYMDAAHNMALAVREGSRAAMTLNQATGLQD